MDAVEDIKGRLNIEDVVGEYVQLKRAGRNFKGMSPFTTERTPSFMVSPEKGIWHDFSSGKGGNMFSFVMEMEGLDFRGALEHLARKAGVDLSQYQGNHSKERAQQKERLYEVLELAAKFYQVQFTSSKTALDYVIKKRQFTRQSALDFRLGYSPNTGNALITFLKAKGFNEQELQRAGLTARAYRGGVQDMFRGRLMIPLMDPQGRVIGFTARLLVDDPNAPKYINTPQTYLYDKGRHVYGLHLAKEAIRKTGFAVLVEGNLDVIASHQAGVQQVVATAGTALTEMHLKTVSRFTNDFRLAFDQDKAGIAATERAIPIAGKVGVSLSIITIPGGKDPDELVRKDPELWRKTIEAHQYALDWLIDKYKTQLDITSAVGKRQFSDVLLKVIRQLPDEVEQDHYVSAISEITGVSREAMLSKASTIARAERPTLKSGKVTPVADTHQFDGIKLQNHFLCLALMRPALREYLLAVSEEMFTTEEARQLYGFLHDNPEFDGKANTAKLKPIADYVKVLSLQYETQYHQDEDVELGYTMTQLRARLVRHYVQTKKQEIRNQLLQHSGNEQDLLAAAQKLDNLLKETKEQA